MAFVASKYRLLNEAYSDHAQATRSSEDLEKDANDAQARSTRPAGWKKQLLWYGLLAASLLLNCSLLFARVMTRRSAPTSQRSVTQFAGLSYDTPVTQTNDSFYGPRGLENGPLADDLWEAYLAGEGQIALDTNRSIEMGLLPSQIFPWDISRSVFYISGYHKLHCVKMLRRSIIMAHRGGDAFRFDAIKHHLHCLDVLRQDIICQADDTPLHSIDGVFSTGEGEVRQCRDWNKLEAWAQQNSACYSFVNETEGVSDELLRYRYCPEGSIFTQNMLDHFGLPEGWKGDARETVPDYSS